MSEVLVLVDHVDGAVKKVALELLTAARALGLPLHLLFRFHTGDAYLAELAQMAAQRCRVAQLGPQLRR